MNKILNWFIGMALAIGFITGTCFYVIPKYIQKKTNGWITFIDGIGPWFSKNWLWLLIVLIVILAAILTIYILLKRKKN